MHLHYKSSLLKCLSGARNINQRLRRGLQTPFPSRTSFLFFLSLPLSLALSDSLSRVSLILFFVPFFVAVAQCILSTNDAFSSASSWNHICPIPTDTPTPWPRNGSPITSKVMAQIPLGLCLPGRALNSFFRNFSMINSWGCLFAFVSLTLICVEN